MLCQLCKGKWIFLGGEFIRVQEVVSRKELPLILTWENGWLWGKEENCASPGINGMLRLGRRPFGGPGFGQDPRPIKSSLTCFNHPAIWMVVMAWLTCSEKVRTLGRRSASLNLWVVTCEAKKSKVSNPHDPLLPSEPVHLFLSAATQTVVLSLDDPKKLIEWHSV